MLIAGINTRNKVYVSTILNGVDAMLRIEFQGHWEGHTRIAEIKTLF